MAETKATDIFDDLKKLQEQENETSSENQTAPPVVIEFTDAGGSGTLGKQAETPEQTADLPPEEKVTAPGEQPEQVCRT